MGVSGGAVLPPIQAVVHDHTNVNISYVIPLIAFCFVLFYSLVGCKWIKYTDDIPAGVDQKDVLSIEDEKPAVIQTEHKQTVAL